MNSFMPRMLIELHVDAKRPITHLRGTLIVSSQLALRKRGHFEAYARALPSEVRDQVLEAMGPTWVPVDVAMAHYRTCEGLGLMAEEVKALGASVADSIQGTFLQSVVRTIRDGATPLVLLGKFDRLFERTFQGGGGVVVLLTGPKDARVTLRGLPMSEIPCFRDAYVGVFEAGIGIFARRAHARVNHLVGPNLELKFDLSWV